MEETNKNNKKWIYVMIAFLLLIALLQIAILFKRSNGNHQNDHALVSQEPNAPQDESSRLFSRPAASRKLLPSLGSTSQPDPFDSDPFAAIQQMRDYMNRLMTTAMTYGPAIAQSLGTNESSNFIPAVDMQETDSAYIVKSDLPGLQKDKINVTVRGNVMTLQGVRETTTEKKDPNGGFYAQERSYGAFARTLTLPGPVDESKVAAQYQDGVLTVTLPKSGGGKVTQKVAVQ